MAHKANSNSRPSSFTLRTNAPRNTARGEVADAVRPKIVSHQRTARDNGNNSKRMVANERIGTDSAHLGLPVTTAAARKSPYSGGYCSKSSLLSADSDFEDSNQTTPADEISGAMRKLSAHSLTGSGYINSNKAGLPVVEARSRRKSCYLGTVDQEIARPILSTTTFTGKKRLSIAGFTTLGYPPPRPRSNQSLPPTPDSASTASEHVRSKFHRRSVYQVGSGKIRRRRRESRSGSVSSSAKSDLESSNAQRKRREESTEERRERLRKLLLKAMRTVRRVAQMGLAMIKLSKKNTTTTLVAQLHYFSAEGNTASQSLSFNKAIFSRKARLNLPDWARVICLTPSHERTEVEVQRLYSIMKTMKSFDKYTPEIQIKICRMAKYTSCDRGRVVLRQGHTGYNFYFIYAGSTFVQLEYKDANGKMCTNTLNVIYRGESFGELALLGDGKRTASIICREPTELFEIEKDTFMELCPDIFAKEMTEKLNLIGNCSLFDGWPDENLQRLCFESQIQDVPHGRILERDTSISEHLYFILKGKVLVLREFSLEPRKYGLIKQKMVSPEYSFRQLHMSPSPDRLGLLKQTRCGNGQAIANDKFFAKIGLLQGGESSELDSLRIGEKSREPGVVLVSQGVRLIRMSKRRLEALAPRGILEAFEKRHLPHLSVPADEDLYDHYVKDKNWKEYKTRLLETLNAEKRGEFLCNRSATSKGSTGWAPWPGFVCVSPSSPLPLRPKTAPAANECPTTTTAKKRKSRTNEEEAGATRNGRLLDEENEPRPQTAFT